MALWKGTKNARPRRHRGKLYRKPPHPGIRRAEACEERLLLSAAVIVGTTLEITGIGGQDIVLRISDIGPGFLEVDDEADGIPDHTFNRALFNSIKLDGGAGDQALLIDESNGVFTDTELTTILGGDGDDSIAGGSGNETLSGGNGNDFISGGRGHDRINGDAGDDALVGRLGNDRLNGGEGNDIAAGGRGDDTYEFPPAAVAQTDLVIELPGGGTDTLRFSVLTPVSVNLNNDTPLNLASHALRSIRTSAVGQAAHFEQVNISPGPASDTVIGNAADNYIFTGGGNDSLVGNAGHDTLQGSSGADVLTGGEGNDCLVGGAASDVYRFGPAVAAQTDTVIELAGGGTDRLDFGALLAADPVSVDLNNDTPLNIAGHTNRSVRTGAAGQAANFENVRGGAGNDLITGNAANNNVAAGAGDDTVDGGAGNDTLDGGSGSDRLIGGAGNDRLTGSAGNDTLEGGAGNDTHLGGDGDDSVLAGDGDDSGDGGNGTDTMVGGLGSDTCTTMETEDCEF